jgi:hypothetical protein
MTVLHEAVAIIDALLEQRAMPDEQLDKRIAVLRMRLALLELAIARVMRDYDLTDEVNSNTVGELIEAIK